MVRSATYRQKKYEAKITGDVVKARIDALKDVMAEQTAVRFSDLVALETQIKQQILEPKGVPTIMFPFYLNVGRELYRLSQKFTGQALSKEAKIVRDKWVARGCNAEIVDAIINLMGITLPE